MSVNGRLSKKVGRGVGGRTARASRCVTRAAANRPMWLNGAKAPAHLNGTIPGDYGFDPLGLGTNPDRLKWYQEAELMNGRFAMLGAAGIMGAEILGVNGKELTWYQAGAKEYDIPLLPLIAIQAAVMGFLEMKRYQGYKEKGVTGVFNDFPFDPAGMLSEEMKVKEVKNARLAMVAMFGFTGQAAVTGAGPVENLKSHLSNPFGNNIINSVLTIQDKLPDPGFAKTTAVQAVVDAAADAAVLTQ